MGSIELKSVSKRFANFVAVRSIELKIEDRERIVFVGPSGCGKSTLLRLICGIDDVSEGIILIDGVDVTAVGSAKRGVAMVFQNYALYPHMTAEQNMGFSLRVVGVPNLSAETSSDASRRYCRWTICCTATRRNFQADNGNASRSGAQWSGGPKRSCSTSPFQSGCRSARRHEARDHAAA